MKKNIFALLLLFAALTIAAQDNLDQLYDTWQDPSQHDSTRVRAYYDYIFNGFLFSNPDSALVMAVDLLNYSNKEHYPKSSAYSYKLQGIVSYLKSNYPNAMDYYDKSLVVFEETGDKAEIAAILSNKGIIHNIQSDYSRAFESYEKSLAIREELGDKIGIAKIMGNIGMIYANLGNNPRALEYYERSLTIKQELGDKKGEGLTMNNIGSLYHSLGNYTRALEYYTKSLAVLENFGYTIGIGSTLGNIGIIYNSQGEAALALEYYEKSLKIEEEMGSNNGIAKALYNIGFVYGENENYLLAIEYYQKSLAIGKEIDDKRIISASLSSIGKEYKKLDQTTLSLNYCKRSLDIAIEFQILEQQKEACQCLYETYKVKGKSIEALEYYEKMISVRDSLYNEENTKKLVQIDMQNQFDRKEAVAIAEQEKKDAIAQEELQRQKLVRNGFMGGFGVVFLFAGVFFVQRNRIGKEKQRSEELLLNILPEETAQELKEKGESEAKLIEYATVLFTDFKGFTAMSEQLSPKDLVKDLHLCFSLFDQICEKHGIEKIKTIGDAYMAAGGLPTPNQTHPTDVVKAGLEMAEVVKKGKAAKIAANLPFFEVRIGVHTGPVVAGIVGVKKFQYDIWGDTVNTASRMESSGEVGRVNISQATYELLINETDFSFESRGKIEAKGKGEIEMFFVNMKTKMNEF